MFCVDVVLPRRPGSPSGDRQFAATRVPRQRKLNHAVRERVGMLQRSTQSRTRHTKNAAARQSRWAVQSLNNMLQTTATRII